MHDLFPHQINKGPEPSSDGKTLVEQASTASVVVASILVVLKAGAYGLSESSAVLASLMDSGLDLIASLTTFFVVRFAHKPPDAEHPFGHGKAEAFSALFQAGLVFASATLVIQESIQSLLDPKPIEHTQLALGVMVVSIVLTLGLLWLQNRALKKSLSVALSADRMHYVSDLGGNLAVILSLLGVGFGFVILDGLAGISIGAFLMWGAIKVLMEASDHLMDKGLPRDEIMHIKALAESIPEVINAHEIRTRIAGPHLMIQMHVELPASLSLIEAHKLLLKVETNILKAFPNADIILHPDPSGHAEPHGGVFAEGEHDIIKDPELKAGQ